MTKDLISDMLTRLRNASLVRHSSTNVNYNKLVLNVLKVFLKEGYIQDLKILEITEKKKKIKVFLKYKGWWLKKPVFTKLQRISKPGQRIYSSYKNFQKKIPVLEYSQGIAVLSTSVGIMGHEKAVMFRQGGEILCYIE